MTKKIVFPQIIYEMKLRGETQQDLANFLGEGRTVVNKKINGRTQWTINDAKLLCLHYGKEFWILFREEEK